MEAEPFCHGLAGRDLCASCAGRIPEDQRGNVRVLHNPWPFDPCPHYVKPEHEDGVEGRTK